MKIKSLLMVALLFALAVGNINAQNNRDSVIPSQGFEDGLGDWTISSSSQGQPQGSPTTTTSYTGDYSFSFQYHSQDYSYLITPELQGTTDVGIQLEFYYTNYAIDGASSFRVGYSTTDTDIESFEFGELVFAYKGTVYGEGVEDEGWERFAKDFPVGVKYIAIAYPGDQLGANLYVDDICITTTPCALPAEFQVEETTKNSISLSWKGSSNSYELQYAPFQFCDFEYEDASDFYQAWKSFTFEEVNGEMEIGFSTWLCDGGEIGYEESDYCAYSDLEGYEGDNYLVSPLIPLGGSVSFYASCEAYEYVPGNDWKSVYAGTQFEVLVYLGPEINESTSINVLDDFIPIDGPITANAGNFIQYTFPLDSYNDYTEGDKGFVIIRHINDIDGEETEEYNNLLIDNFTVYNPWMSVEGITSNAKSTINYTIEGLVYETDYAIQLRGVYNNPDEPYSSWTDALNVQTEEADHRFVTNGNWNEESNWENGELPEEKDDVTVAAHAVIPEDCIANANSIVVKFGKTITIADGGQLKHHNAGVVVTMEKDITGYENEDGNDHYYLLGFPNESSLHPSNVTNMMPNDGGFDYDLYYFSQYEDGAEWANYKDENANPDNFWFFTGNGFLYARSEDATLSATFELNPSGESYTIESVPYVEGHTFSGWNLIANPFACNAYLSGNRGFYRLVETAEGSRIQLADEDNGGSVIAPMEGIFVQVEPPYGEDITFTTTEPETVGAMMDFTLRKASLRSATTLDRSRVVFGEGHNMGHLDLMADPSRIYFPIDDKAMAVVYSQPVGELPLNLEVATEGAFVLAFDCRAENLVYCHLIDNLTGADVDLLQQPEYAFEARVSDYASRFRVVFAKANEDGATVNDEFAYLFNGNLVVTNEGLATLQVIDLQGRMISSETIDGCVSKNLQAAPGVYVLRLINGENVMTQKIVVR